jgi:hypothetical protein
MFEQFILPNLRRESRGDKGKDLGGRIANESIIAVTQQEQPNDGKMQLQNHVGKVELHLPRADITE